MEWYATDRWVGDWGGEITRRDVIGWAHLGKFRLLVDERHDVERLDGDQIEGVLIVDELDVLPADVLLVVLLLFQFEDVAHEELLQVLVGVIDAELLEADSDENQDKQQEIK